jgi:uncharacterized protein YciI
MLTEAPTPIEEAFLDQHFNYLQTLTQQGIVLLAGRILTSDENTFGVVIYRAETLEAAVAIMQNDPAVMNGVMRAELFPFRVALKWA